jgi:hypothetical protein
MKPWEETWELHDHNVHNSRNGEWMHTIKIASCPHDGECEVTTFERENASGRCDDEFEIVLARARLAASAPDLYRALMAVTAAYSSALDLLEHQTSAAVNMARAAMKKARGES